MEKFASSELFRQPALGVFQWGREDKREPFYGAKSRDASAAALTMGRHENGGFPQRLPLAWGPADCGHP